MSFVNRQLYKQKPQIYGPVSSVQASIFKNAERIGIDHASIALAMPMWERSGFTAYDYSKNKAHGLLTSGITWDNDNVRFASGNYINITSPTIINLPETKKISALFQCTQIIKSTTLFYSFLSWGGTDDLLIYPYDAVSNRGYRVFWRDTSLNLYTIDTTDFSNVLQILAFSAGEGEQRIYRYGNQLAYDTKSLTNAGPFNSFRIGSWADGSQQFLGLGSFLYLFSEVIKPTQIAYLSNNPYFLLHRVPPVFYSVPGGTPPTFNPLFLHAAQPTRVIQ